MDEFSIPLSQLRGIWMRSKLGANSDFSRAAYDLHFRLTIWILRARYWERRALKAEKALDHQEK